MSIATKAGPEIPTSASVLAILRRHEDELRRAGVLAASLFGSVARGDADIDSDVDLMIRLEERDDLRGLAKIGQIMDARDLLTRVVGRPVDVVTEPIGKARLKSEIERDKIVAFA